MKGNSRYHILILMILICTSVFGTKLCFQIEKNSITQRNKLYFANSYSDFSSVKISESNVSYTANSWDELASIISSDTYTYNSSTNVLTRKVLNITLKSSTNWTVNKSIKIEEWQKINIIPESSKNIIFLRNASHLYTFFDSYGEFTIGNDTSTGKISFDGNKSNVTSNRSFINAWSGKLNIYKNVKFFNNKKSNDVGTGGRSVVC